MRLRLEQSVRLESVPVAVLLLGIRLRLVVNNEWSRKVKFDTMMDMLTVTERCSKNSGQLCATEWHQLY